MGMKKMRVPEPAIIHKMTRDGIPVALAESILALGPEGTAPPGRMAIENDPKFQPYLKMLKMRVPQPAVEHRMRKDGIHPVILSQNDRSKPFDHVAFRAKRARERMNKNSSSSSASASSKVAEKIVNDGKTRKTFHWSVAEDESRYEHEFSVFKGGKRALELERDFTSLFVERTISPKSMRRKKGENGGKGAATGK